MIISRIDGTAAAFQQLKSGLLRWYINAVAARLAVQEGIVRIRDIHLISPSTFKEIV